MERKLIGSFFLPLLLLISCSDSEFEQGEGDMLYKIVEDKAGEEMEDFCFLTVSYREETEGGELIQHTGSFDSKPAFMYKNEPVFKGDLNSALEHLSEGDSAVIKISVDSLKKYNGYRPAAADQSRYVIYNLRVNKVITRQNMADSVFGRKIENYKVSEIERYRKTEQSKIQQFIKAKGLNYRTTKTGLYVPSMLQWNNAYKPGDTLTVNYIITSLDNDIFETNIEAAAKEGGIFHPRKRYEPLKVVIERDPTSGFREAILYTAKNSKKKFIIPSQLAYGSKGTRFIASYTPLVCEFEVLDK